MPDPRLDHKPDWKKLVRERLSDLDLSSDAKNQVIAELAAHLEDSEDADEPTEISWRRLKHTIEHAKRQEEPMTHRARNLWLPGIAILFGVGLLLLFLDRAAVVQRLIWLGCMAMLLCAARSEGNRLNQRTRSILLPGFVSLTAATLSVFAAEMVLVHHPSYYFTDISLRPDYIVRPASWFYFGWLLTQILCGAVGAFLSRRAEGTLPARVVAATFPATVMLALWAVVIPVSALVEHNGFLWVHPLYYLTGVFIWVVPPAIALVAGAAPFLKEPRPVET
jgi:hypothetical protein